MSRKETEEGRGRQRASMRGAESAAIAADGNASYIGLESPLPTLAAPLIRHGAITPPGSVHEDILS